MLSVISSVRQSAGRPLAASARLDAADERGLDHLARRGIDRHAQVAPGRRSSCHSRAWLARLASRPTRRSATIWPDLLAHVDEIAGLEAASRAGDSSARALRPPRSGRSRDRRSAGRRCTARRARRACAARRRARGARADGRASTARRRRGRRGRWPWRGTSRCRRRAAARRPSRRSPCWSSARPMLARTNTSRPSSSSGCAECARTRWAVDRRLVDARRRLRAGCRTRRRPGARPCRSRAGRCSAARRRR